MRYQQQHIVLQQQESRCALLQQFFPVLRIPAEFFPDLLVKLLGGGVEEFKLEQVAQFVYFVPEDIYCRRAKGFAGLEQRQLGDGLVDEEMNYGVAIVTGDGVLVLLDGIHHVRALVVPGHHALGNHNAEQPLHLLGIRGIKVG